MKLPTGAIDDKGKAGRATLTLKPVSEKAKPVAAKTEKAKPEAKAPAGPLKISPDPKRTPAKPEVNRRNRDGQAFAKSELIQPSGMPAAHRSCGRAALRPSELPLPVLPATALSFGPMTSAPSNGLASRARLRRPFTD